MATINKQIEERLQCIEARLPNGEIVEIHENVKEIKEILLDPEDGLIVRVNKNTYWRRELDADEFLHLCDECEPIWIKYGENREYPEKYCFVCGNEHETSVKRPFCKDCTYDRKWNDDEYEEQVQKNIDKYIGDN